MRTIIQPLLLLVILTTAAGTVSALPPYIAIDAKEDVPFKTVETCTQAAKQVLKDHGFEKIHESKTAPTLFAADEADKDYRYKATIKCLLDYHVVVIVVVTEMPKKALAKLKELSNAFQKYVNTHATDTTHDTPPTQDNELKLKSLANEKNIVEYINNLSGNERKVLSNYLQSLEKMEKAMPTL